LSPVDPSPLAFLSLIPPPLIASSSPPLPPPELDSSFGEGSTVLRVEESTLRIASNKLALAGAGAGGGGGAEAAAGLGMSV
jgi:hypothetical protein